MKANILLSLLILVCFSVHAQDYKNLKSQIQQNDSLINKVDLGFRNHYTGKTKFNKQTYPTKFRHIDILKDTLENYFTAYNNSIDIYSKNLENGFDNIIINTQSYCVYNLFFVMYQQSRDNLLIAMSLEKSITDIRKANDLLDSNNHKLSCATASLKGIAKTIQQIDTISRGMNSNISCLQGTTTSIMNQVLNNEVEIKKSRKQACFQTIFLAMLIVLVKLL